MTHNLHIAAPGVDLNGRLVVPVGAHGIVLIAHGAGATREPENRWLARALHQHRFATLVVDLLTADEERVEELDGCIRFDAAALASRLVAATDRVRALRSTAMFPVGYLAEGPAAAAALIAAARRPGVVQAIVTHDGRPDLARAALPRVRAATMMVVGEDPSLIAIHREALAEVVAPARLIVEAGVTPPRLAQLAAEHFVSHLGPLETVTRRWLGDALC